MATFFTITLLVSCAGMALLLWLKRYELRTGRVFFAQVRPAVGAFFGGALGWIEHVLPVLVAQQARRAYVWGRAQLRATVAWVIIFAEGLLERTLHVLRRKTNVAHHGEASPFLREVAEHKKKLLEEREDQS